MRIEDLVLTFVLNALWQVPAAIAVAALGAQFLRRGPARHRHALWVAALAAGVLLPIASLLPREEPRAAIPAAPAPAALQGTGGEAWAAWLPLSGSPERASFPPLLARAAALLWALSLAIHLVRLGRAWRWTRRLAREARPAGMPERAAAIVERCRKAFGLGPVEILCTSRVGGPVTLGARRPAILLPEGFLAGSPDDHLIAALGHEMAHIQRRDYAVHLLCEIWLLPVAFHPAVRLLRRRLAEAREMACDEAAVERLIGARAYARSLLSMASTLAGLSRPAYTLGALDADILEVRMRRILDVGPRLGVRRARARLGAALLLLGGIAATASVLSVQAVASEPTAAGLEPFVGTWSGDWPWPHPDKKPGEEKPMRALDLEILPTGEIVQFWYRYEKAPDGSLKADKTKRSALNVKLSGRTLTFTVREEDVKFKEDRPPVPVEIVGSIELRGRDEAVFRILSHSYFDAAKKRGESVPPPPPPISMKRTS